jgi:uncharacterized protein DUF4136
MFCLAAVLRSDGKEGVTMKAIHTFLVLFFIGFTVSCASIYGVQYEYDKQVNFESLKTYDWLPIPEKATLDSLVVNRVKNAVNAELQAKGLTMTSDNPDFFIAEHLGKKDKVKVTNWGYGYGSHGRYRGGYWGPQGVDTYQYEEGSLILDFVDAKSKKMIWRGVAKAQIDDTNTPEKSEKLINEAVQEILKNFPPASSK